MRRSATDGVTAEADLAQCDASRLPPPFIIFFVAVGAIFFTAPLVLLAPFILAGKCLALAQFEIRLVKRKVSAFNLSECLTVGNLLKVKFTIG